MTRLKWTCPLLAGLLTLCGCQFKGGNPHTTIQTSPGHTNTPQGLAMWQPTPTRIRVYPSTHFKLLKGQPVFDVQLELQDQMGDSVKAAGTFHLDLHSGTYRGRGLLGPKLYTWDVPLHSLADQQQYYDPITRAYHLQLKMDRLRAPNEQLTLRAIFQKSNDQRLEILTSFRAGSWETGGPAHPNAP